MKVHILGEDNPEPTEISSEGLGILGLLIKVLDLYRKTGDWKNKPILITFSNTEELRMIQNSSYIDEDESESAYLLRMLDMSTKRINESKRLVGGFSATFTTETLGNTNSPRRISILFYEPPIHTALHDTNSFTRPQSPNFWTILGRDLPATP